MTGKIELTFIGILVLATLLGLGLLDGPGSDPEPVQHDPYTAAGLAWNN